MNLPKSYETCIEFAARCRRFDADPRAFAELCLLVDRAVRAQVRDMNEQDSTRSARAIKRADKRAAEMGWSLDWSPGLHPIGTAPNGERAIAGWWA